jgi:hypothetical protein
MMHHDWNVDSGLLNRASVPIELALLAVFGLNCGIAVLFLCFLARPIHLDFIEWLTAVWAPPAKVSMALSHVTNKCPETCPQY